VEIRTRLVLFCAEQGFAGAFSERVLGAVSKDLATSELFLIGTRGNASAAERGIHAAWDSPMPSHSLGVPKLADRIPEVLYTRFAGGAIDRLDAVFSQWRSGHGILVEHRRLFPLDMSGFSRATNAGAPILNLAPEPLLMELTADYVQAQLCKTALHAFAAENEAQMEAMASDTARSSASFRRYRRSSESCDRRKSRQTSSSSPQASRSEYRAR
jgi:F-type H+-transporting ATPase subunit gamma